ncbi:glycosyltransferase family protein [Wolffia australiana]
MLSEGVRLMTPCLILGVLILAFLPHPTQGIRNNIGLMLKKPCRTTVPGRYLLADDQGYVCTALSFEAETHCCPKNVEKFSCQGCKMFSNCCNSYEYCVSCCLSPHRTPEELVLKIRIAKPITAGYYESVFDFCAGRCRHSSLSVVHENAYASDFHHCFSLSPNNSALPEELLGAGLSGINIVVGSRGENCNSVCGSKGQSCVPNRLSVLNKCDFLQRHMSCKSGCLSSMGADQPAEVVDDAPVDSNPGACLFTRQESMLSCGGAHQHTRRLCPCA